MKPLLAALCGSFVLFAAPYDYFSKGVRVQRPAYEFTAPEGWWHSMARDRADRDRGVLYQDLFRETHQGLVIKLAVSGLNKGKSAETQARELAASYARDKTLYRSVLSKKTELLGRAAFELTYIFRDHPDGRCCVNYRHRELAVENRGALVVLGFGSPEKEWEHAERLFFAPALERFKLK